MSRVCEEFHCLPSQAVRELEDDPDQLALAILPLRAYARAKADLDSVTDPAQMGKLVAQGGLYVTVKELTLEAMEQAIGEREAGDDGSDHRES